MKQHLNTLFITTEGAYLAKDGQALAVRIDRRVKLRVPLHNLDGVVCLGRISCSPSLMAACGEAGVTISLCDQHGRFRAAVVGFSPGNVLLRRNQYRLADDPVASCKIARLIVAAKIANSRAVVLRAARESTGQRQAELQIAARRLLHDMNTARKCTSLDSLRGREGESASTYFGVFPHLLAGDPAFSFTGRSRRPPLDPFNAVLSFLYRRSLPHGSVD